MLLTAARAALFLETPPVSVVSAFRDLVRGLPAYRAEP